MNIIDKMLAEYTSGVEQVLTLEDFLVASARVLIEDQRRAVSEGNSRANQARLLHFLDSYENSNLPIKKD